MKSVISTLEGKQIVRNIEAFWKYPRKSVNFLALVQISIVNNLGC
jgi:hypothetical protein